MQRILIADTETTGVTPQDEICEVAFVEVNQDLEVLYEFGSLVKPGIPIKPEASAASHITNDMVADAISVEACFCGFPERYFDSILLIGHNSAFDRRYLSRYWGIVSELCTLRMARKLYPNAPNHQLQTLRYYLDLDVESLGGAQAHRALQDVYVTYELLERMSIDTGLSLMDLIEESAKPIEITTMPFGKHKGIELVKLPARYVDWLLNLENLDCDLKIALEKL